MSTKIEWVRNLDGTQGKTWNPVTGCTKVSPGCRHCFAERMARRLAGRYGYPEVPHHFDVTLHPDRLDVPLKRRKPTTYFVCSMSDLFHKDVPTEFIFDVLEVIAQCPQHTFQLLTKRPKRLAHLFRRARPDAYLNLWLGTSVSDQATANERREYLQQCPAAIKFVSYEPALAAVDWTEWEFVSQIISGGESGPNARPSHPDWHRAARDFCQEHGIAYFFKSWGAWLPGLFDSSSWHFVFENGWISAGEENDYFGPAIYGSKKKYPHHLWGDDILSIRVGKKAAGRLLNGKEYNNMPEVRK